MWAKCYTFLQMIYAFVMSIFAYIFIQKWDRTFRLSLFFFLLFCAKLFKFAHMFWNFKVCHFYICVPSKVWERCHYFCVTFYFILCRQMWLIVSRLCQDICVVSSIFLLQYNITHDYDGRKAFECCFHRNNKTGRCLQAPMRY